MTSKAWLITTLGAITLIVTSSLLVASAKFTYKHPRAPGMYFEIGSSGAPNLKMKPELLHAVELAVDKRPVTIVKDNVFDFGEMNPHSIGEHRFVIRNEGDGPLTLKDGGSSCKCAAAQIKNRVLRPGESGEVLVEWNTGSSSDPLFAQFVTLVTNDPQRKEIRLAIKGRVADVCATQPQTVLFPSLAPDQTGRTDILVYSTAWDAFEIEQVKCSLKFLKWEQRPASSDELAEVHARSGFWLTVLAPEDTPAGDFGGELNITVQPADAEKMPIHMSIDVAGNKLGRVSIIGPEINNFGIVELGPVTYGQEKSCRLLLRYRGESNDANPLRIETSPDYLQASLTPRTQSSKSGMFDFEIRVSPDAPLCNHLSTNPAQLRLIRDGSDDPPITLRVEFAVIRP